MTLLFLLALAGIWLYALYLIGRYTQQLIDRIRAWWQQKRQERASAARFTPLHGKRRTSYRGDEKTPTRRL